MKLSDAQCREALHLYWTHGSKKAAAQVLGINEASVRRRIAEAQRRGLDFVRPQPSEHVQDRGPCALAALFREAMDGYQPPTLTYAPNLSASEHLLEICLADMHFGKLAWHRESGENYDLDIARERYLKAVRDLLSRAFLTGIGEIVLLVGSDLLHSDTQYGTTQSGHILDMDGRWQKIYRTALRTVVEATDLCAQVAPTHVVVIPGNHDWQSSFYLGEALSCQYASTPHVTVDNAPTPRKYLRFGSTLIGWTHGHAEKHANLPLIMAQERADDWALTQHRIWHLGHYHKAKQLAYIAGDTHTGVLVEIVPSLCGTDAWHSEQGYVGNPKAGKAYLYHKKHGPMAVFQHNAEQA